jgi:MazG family protein
MLKPIEILISIMSKLRSEGGCAWDREQTHESLRAALIEECCEVIEAIEDKDLEALREELGDILLHVVFHAQIASESGEFDFEQVCAGIVHKMIARHPHVFKPFPTANGDNQVSNAKDTSEILAQWERLKLKEKSERASVLDGVAKALPALTYAQKIQSKAARVGFDWPDATGPRKKIDEELAEAAQAQGNDRLEEELGDVLFAVVNWCRKLGVDAECALMKANRKFERRFREMENMGLVGKSADDMESMWESTKRTERKICESAAI